jgi:hypothetical protein
MAVAGSVQARKGLDTYGARAIVVGEQTMTRLMGGHGQKLSPDKE